MQIVRTIDIHAGTVQKAGAELVVIEHDARDLKNTDWISCSWPFNKFDSTTVQVIFEPWEIFHFEVTEKQMSSSIEE